MRSPESLVHLKAQGTNGLCCFAYFKPILENFDATFANALACVKFTYCFTGIYFYYFLFHHVISPLTCKHNLDMLECQSRTRISVVMPNSSAPVVVQIAVGVEDLVWIRVSIWIWLWMVVRDEVRVGVRVRIHVRGHVDVKVKVQLSGSRSRYIIRY